MRFLGLLLFLLGFKVFSQPETGYKYTQPETSRDGWETGSLKDLNIDTTLIYKLFNQLNGGEHKIHSVLLVNNGQLVIEEYYNGYSANNPHDLRSVTKSIRSILMGIAIDKGFIEDINDPISKYLKVPIPQKNISELKKKITIKHLLTMSGGFDCNDWDKKSKGREDKVYGKKDWLQYALNLPMINEPGTVSHYCSLGAILIAEIISQASGMTIDQFAQKHLFTPLGIDNVSWGHTHQKVIPSAKRLYLTTRDMLKIGQLILDKGKWGKIQVISEAWVEESTTVKTKITGIDYGYFWWNIPFKVEGKVIHSKVATGNGGQYIMVIPEMKIVAAFTGGAYNSEEDKLAFNIMSHVFLPTFK